jgi:hypothetical protein
MALKRYGIERGSFGRVLFDFRRLDFKGLRRANQRGVFGKQRDLRVVCHRHLAMAACACGRCPCSTLIRLTGVRWDPDVTDRLWEMSNAMDMLEAFEDQRSRAA